MRNIFLILALLLSLPSFAQYGKHDVVYLKNGSVVKGNILVFDPEHSVKLKTRDHNIWVFEMTQVDSISRPIKLKTPINTGYFNLTEFGLMAGNSNNMKKAPFTMMNISGWLFANGFSAGIGLGVQFFNETYLPVVADFRYFLRKHGTLPFVSLQSGYSIPLGGEYTQQYYYAYDTYVMGNYTGSVQQAQDVSARGGFLVNPSVGFQTQISDDLALTFSAGYCYMRHRYGKLDTYKLDVDYNRLSLKIGIQFK